MHGAEVALVEWVRPIEVNHDKGCVRSALWPNLVDSIKPKARFIVRGQCVTVGERKLGLEEGKACSEQNDERWNENGPWSVHHGVGDFGPNAFSIIVGFDFERKRKPPTPVNISTKHCEGSW